MKIAMVYGGISRRLCVCVHMYTCVVQKCLLLPFNRLLLNNTTDNINPFGTVFSYQRLVALFPQYTVHGKIARLLP